MNAGSLQLEDVAVGDLAGVELEVAPGEIVCLSGPSGSGKSRLLRAIADLEPHEGEVGLGARSQGAEPAHSWRRSVMLVPAESQWWHEQVGQHFLAPMPGALAELGFEAGVERWAVSRLSSGEKQRLALVRALSVEPEALLLDEPTANLDNDNTVRVETWLTRLVREQGLPVLWVAHDPGQIGRVADRHLHIVGQRLEAVE